MLKQKFWNLVDENIRLRSEKVENEIRLKLMGEQNALAISNELDAIRQKNLALEHEVQALKNQIQFMQDIINPKELIKFLLK